MQARCDILLKKHLKYVAMMLSLAAKIGTGVSVLDTAGIDCQGINALAALYDGYEKVGHDGSIDADEGMSAALARHQTSLDEQAAELSVRGNLFHKQPHRVGGPLRMPCENQRPPHLPLPLPPTTSSTTTAS